MNKDKSTSYERAMAYAKNNFKDLDDDMSKISNIDENQTEEEFEKELEKLNKNFEEWLKDGAIIYKGK